MRLCRRHGISRGGASLRAQGECGDLRHRLDQGAAHAGADLGHLLLHVRVVEGCAVLPAGRGVADAAHAADQATESEEDLRLEHGAHPDAVDPEASQHPNLGRGLILRDREPGIDAGVDGEHLMVFVADVTESSAQHRGGPPVVDLALVREPGDLGDLRSDERARHELGVVVLDDHHVTDRVLLVDRAGGVRQDQLAAPEQEGRHHRVHDHVGVRALVVVEPALQDDARHTVDPAEPHDPGMPFDRGRGEAVDLAVRDLRQAVHALRHRIQAAAGHDADLRGEVVLVLSITTSHLLDALVERDVRPFRSFNIHGFRLLLPIMGGRMVANRRVVVKEKSAEYSERVCRAWKYHIRSCAGSFRARRNQLLQIVLSKNGVPGGYDSIR